jgi:Fic family protein
MSYLGADSRLVEMRERLDELPRRERLAFDELFDIVWIYHDNALEGDVYTPAELRTALSDRVLAVTDSSASSIMRDIGAHKAAIDTIRSEALALEPMPLLPLVKHLHEMVVHDPADRPGRYRKDIQLHRSYFHQIAEPTRISYLLRKLFAWVDSDDAARCHPIKMASKVHHRFIRIYPFEKGTGKVGRLLLNYLLLRDGYQPAVIHAQDRQHYYDCFGDKHRGLTSLVRESVENSIESIHRQLDDSRGQGMAPRMMAP